MGLLERCMVCHSLTVMIMILAHSPSPFPLPLALRFVAPTLLRNVPWDAPIMQEETFGPMLCIQAVSEEVEGALNLCTHAVHPGGE